MMCHGTALCHADNSESETTMTTTNKPTNKPRNAKPTATSDKRAALVPMISARAESRISKLFSSPPKAVRRKLRAVCGGAGKWQSLNDEQLIAIVRDNKPYADVLAMTAKPKAPRKPRNAKPTTSDATSDATS